MAQLSILLKACKPVVPELPSEFSDRVMATLANPQSAAPKKWQVARSYRRRYLVGGVLTSLIPLLFLNAVVFEVQMNGSSKWKL